MEAHEVTGGIASSVPEGYYTTQEAADQVGRSAFTLRKWRRTGRFVPSKWMQAGKLEVWLYSDEDIEKLREFMKTVKPGRPRKEEAEE